MRRGAPQRAGQPVDGGGSLRNLLAPPLLSARTRLLFGQRMDNPSSRFVGDIEAALKEARALPRRPSKTRPEAEQLSLF